MSMGILFDLDGTLLHSAPDLHGAASRMLVEAGQAPLPYDQIRSYIGNGAPKLVERVIAACGLDPADQTHLTARFLAHYAAHPADLTMPYPGVGPALQSLAAAGHRLGICTNKPEAPARQLLAHFGWSDLFAVVVGGDSYPAKKPDPTGLEAGFAALGPGKRLFVGDSEIDGETARRADVPFALFTEGYRKAPPDQIPHWRAFDRFARLPALLADLP